jgi:hypothetical protein
MHIRYRVKNGKTELFSVYSSVAHPDSGSDAFLTPGSGIWNPHHPDGYKIKIRIRDEHPGSYFRELGNNFLSKKYLNSLMRIRMRNPLSGIFLTLDPGSRMEKFGSGMFIWFTQILS